MTEGREGERQSLRDNDHFPELTGITGPCFWRCDGSRCITSTCVAITEEAPGQALIGGGAAGPTDSFQSKDAATVHAAAQVRGNVHTAPATHSKQPRSASHNSSAALLLKSGVTRLAGNDASGNE